MRDPGNSAAVGRAPERAPETEEFVSRKLIRPSLSVPARRSDGGPDRHLTSAEHRVPKRANGALEQTHAEAFYFQKQIQARTPMIIVLKDGEEIHGSIDWYDRNCLKINRGGQPNLLIYKQSIRYIFKAGENNGRG